MKKDISCCPGCKRVIEAKDYLNNPAIIGFLDSVLPTINCSCGYNGLPIKMSIEDYKKLVKESKKL